ncbi:MAG TPA: tRNA (adenosine(37)-N6)-dimethylallyltransferase MiaA [Firmicutes bacterium]|nr:tRNA (adenosine(37)-N6)-dimethylallyltransferase MiaA [Bacillota bacterium]HHY97319.1 tRNA (adenosine(37)-N6)-dimethylallyltransferase MiaA [Bacillota bacterium]
MKSQEGPKVAAIVGPTAVGKTELSILLAEELGAEIISCDSMQIYRHMDIGTAKPSAEERARIPHHLIDIVDPSEDFHVARYQELARATIAEIHSRGKLPMLVGGTGLYLRAAVRDYLFPAPRADWEFRKELEQKARENGPGYLFARLMEIDPASASRLHPNDTRRLIRALEVYHLTGMPISELQRDHTGEKAIYHLALIGFIRPRPSLYKRIQDRVEDQIAAGLIDETRHLLRMGYERRLTSSQAICYKESVDFLYGKSTLEEAIRLMKRNNQRYAKRQITWFKREPGIIWVDLDQFPSKTDARARVKELILRELWA